MLSPDHFSLYALIVEPGTPLHQQVSAGRTPVPDEDVAAEMYAYAIEALGAAGYAHYEISNWARDDGALSSWQTPRLASGHNLIYWRNQPYLGLGAGAYGTINGERWMNVKRPQDYIECIEEGTGLGAAGDEKTYERIGRDTAMAEQMLLGLRLVREGVGATEFETRFDTPLSKQYADPIKRGFARGLLEWVETPADARSDTRSDARSDARLRLTKQGRFLANQVIVEFMLS